jgi:hypothetical protein
MSTQRNILALIAATAAPPSSTGAKAPRGSLREVL